MTGTYIYQLYNQLSTAINIPHRELSVTYCYCGSDKRLPYENLDGKPSRNYNDNYAKITKVNLTLSRDKIIVNQHKTARIKMTEVGALSQVRLLLLLRCG